MAAAAVVAAAFVDYLDQTFDADKWVDDLVVVVVAGERHLTFDLRFGSIDFDTVAAVVDR